MAIATVMLFYFLPVDRIIPEFILIIIKKISSVTMFVYFVHVFIDDVLRCFWGSYIFTPDTIAYSIEVFVISMVLGILISFIPGKIVKECCG